MKDVNKHIQEHYLKVGLYEDILERLQKIGLDMDRITRKDIAEVDEFHVRGAAVSRELAIQVDLTGMKVLDVGCGLGGPCRMLADEFNCDVTGIDLSGEYIRTASNLSRLVKLDDRTRFVQGDAIHLPFEDDSFDAVWTQHVQMNIPDKPKFYSEIARVLRPSGYFLYYDIFKKGDAPVSYPMPWAGHESISFLVKPKEAHQHMDDAGMHQQSITDQTQPGVAFFSAWLERIKMSGPPALGLNVLMGESTKLKLINLLAHLKEGALCLESGIYQNS